MLLDNEGNISKAWEDLLACHRLARLVGQTKEMTSYTFAHRIEHSTLFLDRILLKNARLTSGQLAKMRTDLERLLPMPNTRDAFDLHQRFACLHWALLSQREGLAILKRKLSRAISHTWTYSSPSSATKTALDSAAKEILKMLDTDVPIDWDVVLRTINSCFDRIVEAQRLPAGIERTETIRKVQEDILSESCVSFDPKRDTSETYSKHIGLAFFFTDSLFQSTTLMDDMAAMECEVTKLGFALTQYGIDHSAYPDKLGDLVPKYVAKLPKDIFLRDGELHYRKEGFGFVLYSVGPNGKDDGGREHMYSCKEIKNKDGTTAYRDEEGNVFKDNPMHFDDIVVRTPSK